MKHLAINLILVTGIPRAGKSSLCDAIQSSQPGFTHVPLDRYVKPVPPDVSFLDWIASPDCIAWDHLLAHLEILAAGFPCYTPRPDWANGWRRWLSDGGAITKGLGQRMEPAQIGYLIPGTHTFAYPFSSSTTARVFVTTPDAVVAERLTGTSHAHAEASVILKDRLAPNLDLIRRQQTFADLVIDGTADRPAQVSQFHDFYHTFSRTSPVLQPHQTPCPKHSRPA